MPHMGDEFQGIPDEQYVSKARNMCRLGADIVMASHPHVLQPTEIFEVEENGASRTCFIAYSMGNFISGLDWKPCDAGAIFYLDFEKAVDEHGGSGVRLVHASYAPTWVQLKDINDDAKIRILHVSDTLKALESGENAGLRERDITRLKNAHRETALTLLGEEAPEMLPEYTLYRVS